MYNDRKIEKFRARYQKRIDRLVKDAEIELTRIVKKELLEGDTLVCGMGSVSLINANGEVVDNNFTNLLSALQHNGNIDAGVCVLNITK